jgi:hypothetical protein
VRLQAQSLELRGRWFGSGGIVSTVEVSGHRQAGLSSGGANEVEDLLVTFEWFAGPVLGDLGKQTVLNGVPFGSASRVVGNSESQTKRIGQLRLKFCFPGAATIAIAAACVTQNEELPGAWIATRSLLAPPMRDGVGCKGGGVVRDAHHDRPSISKQIIDTVRDGDSGGVGSEVVVIDQAGRQIPTRAGILEMADQFALLGVDANDGQATALESLPKITEVKELVIAIGTMVSGEGLVIDPERIAHFVEQTGDGVGTDDDTEVAQRQGDLICSSPGPLQPSDGITGGVVFEQELD